MHKELKNQTDSMETQAKKNLNERTVLVNLVLLLGALGEDQRVGAVILTQAQLVQRPAADHS